MWCNGWVTSHRFKEENDVGCIFGCKWAPDQLEHYAECGVCQQIWYKLAKIHAYNGPLGFFALGEEADSILTLRCVFMFAVHSVVIRQHALRCVLSTQQSTRAVTERWKYVLGISSHVRFSFTWTRHNVLTIRREIGNFFLRRKKQSMSVGTHRWDVLGEVKEG